METKFDNRERNAGRNSDCENDVPKKGLWNRFKESSMKFTTVFALGAVLAAGSGCYHVGKPDENIPFPDGHTTTEKDAGDNNGTVDTDTDADTDSGIDTDTDGGTETPGGHLIGDYLNRVISDRVGNVAGDINAEYTMGGSDTTDNANPFTDGNGGTIGPTETFMYKITPDQFPPLADQALVNSASGDAYTEMQAIWMSGDNHFSTDVDDVVGRLGFLAYTMKFNGPGSGETGIPVCSEGPYGDYTACKTNAGGTTFDDATEAQRLTVWFLGEQWIITEMNAPEGTLGNETTLVNGGSIKLAKESVSGILKVGEVLPADAVKFKVDSLETADGVTSAIILVLDANDNVLNEDKVAPGQTKEFMINGQGYKFHVYKAALGSTPETQWADVAIFAKEIALADSQQLDSNNGTNPGYTVALGWKNRAASAVSKIPDSLRTIVIYAEDVEDLSSSGGEDLEAGDYVPIVQDPAAWKLAYEGLDISSDDRKDLTFEIRTTNLEIPASKGPYMAGEQVACTIGAPYMKVTSGASGHVFSANVVGLDGTLSDNDFIVVMNTGSQCGYAPVAVGSVLMHVVPALDQYGISAYQTGGKTITYGAIGGGSKSFGGGGAIVIEKRQDVENAGPGENAIGNMLQGIGQGGNVCTTPECADVYIAIAEKAGSGVSNGSVDYWLMGVAHADAPEATFDFVSNSGNLPLTSDKGELLYVHAGPVTQGAEMVEEGYVSERGSKYEALGAKAVVFNMTNKLAKAVWSIVQPDTFKVKLPVNMTGSEE